MTILSESQLQAVKLHFEELKPGKEGKKLGKKAVKHINLMIDVKPAQDLIDQKLCDSGKQYNSSTLFNAAQYKNHLKITPQGSQLNKFDYKKFTDAAWKQFSAQMKVPWADQAKLVKAMAKSEDVKPFVVSGEAKRCKICPACLLMLSNNSNHLADIHFPLAKTDETQKLRLERFEIELKRNPNLHVEWNRELKKFWNDLFIDHKELSAETIQDIEECEKHIENLKSKTGEFSVYSQVQVPAGQLECGKDNLTQVHHYTGKNIGVHRYFDGKVTNGRVGYEHKRAILSSIEIYIYTTFDNLDEESAKVIEHCKMLALFHLDFKLKNVEELPNVWNVNATSLPKGHAFCKLDPKLLVKIGLMLWCETLVKFHSAVQDKTFFDSPKIVAYYNRLPTDAKKQKYIENCGDFEPPRDNSGKRTAKKRKLEETPVEDNSNASESAQLQMTPAIAQYLVAALDSGKTVDQLRAEAQEILKQSPLSRMNQSISGQSFLSHSTSNANGSIMDQSLTYDNNAAVRMSIISATTPPSSTDTQRTLLNDAIV